MKTKILAVLLLASLAAFGGGCALLVVGAAAGAGAGGYAYVNGELKSTESASLDKSFEATLAAMKDLNYPVINQSKDVLQAQVTARNSSDKKIVVSLKKVAAAATEFRIRVDTFGDEALSRKILTQIQSHL
jgi:alanine dehydrogenase